MNTTRATIEIIAPTIEEAVEKGLAELGLPQEAVDVEILDAGSRGLFGLGSRQARIRLIVKGAQVPEATPTTAVSEPEEETQYPEETAPDDGSGRLLRCGIRVEGIPEVEDRQDDGDYGEDTGCRCALVGHEGGNEGTAAEEPPGDEGCREE